MLDDHAYKYNKKEKQTEENEKDIFESVPHRGPCIIFFSNTQSTA